MKRYTTEHIFTTFGEHLAKKGQEVTIIACELDEKFLTGVKVTVAEFEEPIDASFLTKEI